MKGGIRPLLLAGMAALLVLLGASACTRSKPRPSGLAPLPTLAAATPQPAPLTPTVTPSAVAKVYPDSATPLPTLPPITPTLQPTLVLILPTLQPTSVFTTPWPTPTSTATPTSAPTYVRHVVKTGETLSQLARTYRTTTAAILSANPTIGDPDHLRVGTVLSITVGTVLSVRTHTVRVGESLFSIARRYGLSTQALAQANGISNPSQIRVGQVLVIPH